MAEIQWNDELEGIYERGVHALRLGGFKITPSRRYVLRKVVAEQGPHSVQSLLADAPIELQLDQSTVYRTVATFCDMDMISEVRLPGSRQVHYIWKHWEHHHHIVCRKCGKVSHAHICPREEVERLVEETTGYKLVEHHLEFSGLCEDCQPPEMKVKRDN